MIYVIISYLQFIKGKISKELYQPLSRQNTIFSQSKYTLYSLIHLKPSLHSSTISTSEHIYYKNSVLYYHTNRKAINIKNNHRNSCQCHQCHQSHFHSSPHLYEQEQIQKEIENDQETQIIDSSELEQKDVRKQTIQQTEESRNNKIDFIVDEIAKLNLLEVATLVSTLKTRLNLPDTAMMGSAMPMSAMPAAAAPQGDAQEAGIFFYEIIGNFLF